MASDETGAEAGTATSAEKTAKFTDDDMAKQRRSLEAQFAKKLDKAVNAAQSTLLSDLGYDSADELREALASAADRQSAESQTQAELKKLVRERDKLAKERDEAAALAAKLDGDRRASIAEKAVHAASAALKAHGDLVHAIVRGTITVGDDGEPVGPDGQSVAEYITAVVEKDPRLLANPSGAGSLPGSNSAPTGPDLSTREGRYAAMKAAGIGYGGRER